MKKIFYLILSLFLLSACNTSQTDIFDKGFITKRMKSAYLWQQQNPKWALYDWTNATYYRGISEAWKTTGDQDYFNTIEIDGKSYDWKLGERWYHADDLAIGSVYLDVFNETQDSSILVRTKRRLDANLKDQEWHLNPERHHEHHVITQPWWWCDALFMGPPVFVQYAKIMDDDKYLHFSDSLFIACYDSLYDKKEHLFARDLRYKWKGDSTDIKDQFGNKIFWSRGNGWVLGGLALILEDLPKDFPSRHFYEDLFEKMASRLKEIQPDDGLWRPALLDTSAIHGELSGSALYTYAIASGINQGILSRDEFLPVVKKSWSAIVNCQREDGMVGWVQAIGKDPRPTTADSWEVFGTGVFLMAGSEMIKLVN